MASEHILPGEGDSGGKGAVLVASGPVVYTDKDRAVAIVVVKPSMTSVVTVLGLNYHIR